MKKKKGIVMEGGSGGREWREKDEKEREEGITGRGPAKDKGERKHEIKVAVKRTNFF